MAEIRPGDTAYEVPENPTYDPVVRKLKTTDPANADTIFNPLFSQLIENIHAVKLSDDTRANSDLSNVTLENFNEYVSKSGIAGANGSIAPKAKTALVSIRASAWPAAAPYTQEVAVAEMTANALVFVAPVETTNNINEISKRKVRATAQSNGSLTFTAETKPDKDVSFVVVNWGDM